VHVKVDVITVIRYVSIGAKFDICTVVGLVEAKIRIWDTQCAYLNFEKRPIQKHDATNAKFSTN
jgi:hypothetical protein